MCYIRLFYNSSAARVGTYISREDVLGLPTPEPAPQLVSDGIRHLVLDDDEDVVSPTPDPIPAPITPVIELITKENHDEMVYKYRYLNSLEFQVIFGNFVFWRNRLGTLDRYCLWDKNAGPERRTIYMSESEAAILLNTGYSILCTDIQRHARRILSQEMVRFRFEPRPYPAISIGLEIVLEGIIYTAL